ncbi:hypothetical protein [Paraburkholderia sp. 31.1]|uniref:hypothetical protein n=1 Tax=Paraburkholderia sp. 31.1 TaxID=2615205 RepID=UPI001654FD93|nr:hypothetical protein [Paraburkholderia sp. 31.1]
MILGGFACVNQTARGEWRSKSRLRHAREAPQPQVARIKLARRIIREPQRAAAMDAIALITQNTGTPAEPRPASIPDGKGGSTPPFLLNRDCGNMH